MIVFLTFLAILGVSALTIFFMHLIFTSERPGWGCFWLVVWVSFWSSILYQATK